MKEVVIFREITLKCMNDSLYMYQPSTVLG